MRDGGHAGIVKQYKQSSSGDGGHLDIDASVVVRTREKTSEHASSTHRAITARFCCSTSLLLAECDLLLLVLRGLDLEQGVEFGEWLPVRVAHAVRPREVLCTAKSEMSSSVKLSYDSRQPNTENSNAPVRSSR